MIIKKSRRKVEFHTHEVATTPHDKSKGNFCACVLRHFFLGGGGGEAFLTSGRRSDLLKVPIYSN